MTGPLHHDQPVRDLQFIQPVLYGIGAGNIADLVPVAVEDQRGRRPAAEFFQRHRAAPKGDHRPDLQRILTSDIRELVTGPRARRTAANGEAVRIDAVFSGMVGDPFHRKFRIFRRAPGFAYTIPLFALGIFTHQIVIDAHDRDAVLEQLSAERVDGPAGTLVAGAKTAAVDEHQAGISRLRLGGTGQIEIQQPIARRIVGDEFRTTFAVADVGGVRPDDRTAPLGGFAGAGGGAPLGRGRDVGIGRAQIGGDENAEAQHQHMDHPEHNSCSSLRLRCNGKIR